MANLIFGTSGDDTLNGSFAEDIIYGYSGDDTLIGTFGNDTLYGGSGHDALSASNGGNLLIGGTGNDTIESSYSLSQNDTIYGGHGDDTISTLYSSGLIDGGKGDDVIESINSSHIIQAGRGNDTIQSSNSTDTIYGGLGDDTIYVQNPDFAFGDSSVGILFIFTSLNVKAGHGNDTVIASSGDDFLHGGKGNDFIFDGSGNDTVEGGRGDDLIQLDLGNDILNAGRGDDSLNASLTVGEVITPPGSNGGLPFIPIHTNGFFFTDGDFPTLVPFTLHEVTVEHYTEGRGNDTINMGKGNDVVAIGSGNDSVTLGAGNDFVLIDNDSFSFGSWAHTTITDFNSSQDKLVINTEFFPGMTPFDWVFEQVGNDVEVSIGNINLTLQDVQLDSLSMIDDMIFY